MNKLLLISVFVVSITVTFGQQSTKAQGGRFRASVVKIDITPADSQMLLGYQARKSIGILDHIYHRIIVLRIDKEDGTPLALIANYPVHGTVLSQANLKISGDAPGIVAEYVEQKLGVPLVFINGAMGNLAPIYSVYPDSKSGHLGQFRVLLGDKILDANRMIPTTTNEVKLITGALTIETPRKAGMDWTSDLGDYTRTTKAGNKMVKLPIRFLKINENVAIWSAPLELFCEISNEIRDRSPFPFTFYFGLTNGWLGYMLPESEFKHGGYEPDVSPYTPSAARYLTESVVSYLKGEMLSLHPVK